MWRFTVLHKYRTAIFVKTKCLQLSEQSFHNLRNKNAIIFGKALKKFANVRKNSYLCTTNQ